MFRVKDKERIEGPISPEAAAVKPDIQKPVSLVVRFFGGRIDQIPAIGIVSFHTDLDL